MSQNVKIGSLCVTEVGDLGYVSFVHSIFPESRLLQWNEGMAIVLSVWQFPRGPAGARGFELRVSSFELKTSPVVGLQIGLGGPKGHEGLPRKRGLPGARWFTEKGEGVHEDRLEVSG
jgi:hypothetical protein